MRRVLQNSIARFLISYLLMLIIPLAITWVGFQIAFRIVENNLIVTHSNMLQRSADIIENELMDIESVALQIANDTSVLEMAGKHKGDGAYIGTAVDALDKFTFYLNYKDIDLMDSQRAYIYLKNADLVAYTKSYYKPSVFKKYLTEWAIDYDIWYAEMTSADLVAPGFRENGNGFEYVFPFSKVLFGERQANIVLRIDGDAVIEKMEFINNLQKQDTYLVEILQANGDRVWNSGTIDAYPELTIEELEQGYLVKDGLSILTVKSERMNWYYVLVLPVKQSLSELATLKNMVLLLMLLAVLMGLLVAVIQSFKKGKPVEVALQALTQDGEKPQYYANLGIAVSEIVKHHQNALQEIEKSKASLQRTFFADLLKANFTTEAQLKLEAENADVHIENRLYQTAFIQFFAENDLTLVDEQTVNEIKVISKLVKDHLRELCGESVWFHKKNYNSEIAIFAIDGFEEDVYTLIRQTKEWIAKEGNIEITSGIGGTCNNLLLIWRSMEEARIALEHCTRFVPIVSYNKQMVEENEYYYPNIAAEKLKECLHSGQWQETRDILNLLETENSINRKLSRSQYIKLNQRLIDTLPETIKKEAIREKAIWLNEVIMQPEIQPKEYFYRVKQLCRAICNDNAEKKQEQKSQMVEEIKAYIELHYQDYDMGLSKVGSEFRVSESYLSTLFKEQSGMNFTDFLEGIRIEKACELLKNRKITVNEVAEKIGYNSVQSFRRAFKRVKGVSPKEVRENVG